LIGRILQAPLSDIRKYCNFLNINSRLSKFGIYSHLATFVPVGERLRFISPLDGV